MLFLLLSSNGFPAPLAISDATLFLLGLARSLANQVAFPDYIEESENYKKPRDQHGLGYDLIFKAYISYNFMLQCSNVAVRDM
jgi:hypothetical protein